MRITDLYLNIELPLYPDDTTRWCYNIGTNSRIGIDLDFSITYDMYERKCINDMFYATTLCSKYYVRLPKDIRKLLYNLIDKQYREPKCNSLHASAAA